MESNGMIYISEQSHAYKLQRLLNKRVPITSWLVKYSIVAFLQDLLAGLTVALTEIPQGIAYAAVAGLPPQYGLYAGFMGCFMYCLFGSCKDINIGPTAIIALMIQHHSEHLGPDGVILLAFLSGAIILALGLLNLGFIVDFFSYPVVSGFTCAAALSIATSQIKSLLGLSGKANEFLESLISVYQHIHETKLWDAVLGVVSIILLMSMRELKRFGSAKTNPLWSTRRNVIGRCLWYLSLGRNVILVILSGVLVYVFKENGKHPFSLIDKVVAGLPNFRVPPFTTHVNGTDYQFIDMIKSYGSSIIFVPLISILETIAIAKAFSKGKSLDATQELIALGICNFMGSFVSSMPVTGSFTRTAINNASGVVTPFGGAITGTIVLLTLSFLTSLFVYIPKTILAAIIITSMFYLFEYEAIVTLWHVKKLDLIPFTVTLLASLFFSLEYGILIGIGVNLSFVLYATARPPIKTRLEKFAFGDAFIIEMLPNMQFPSAEYLRERIMNEYRKEFVTKFVVIDGSEVKYVDSTIRNINALIDELKDDCQMFLWNFNERIVDSFIGIDKNFARLCQNGSLEDILKDDYVIINS